jgi:hypothetical protein
VATFASARSLATKQDDSMTEQYEFCYVAPEVESEDVVVLINYLEGLGWQSARSIKRAKGWNERKIRAVAHASAGKIISSDRGYRTTKSASLDEIFHSTQRLKSQAKHMLDRVVEIERVRHGGKAQ